VAPRPKRAKHQNSGNFRGLVAKFSYTLLSGRWNVLREMEHVLIYLDYYEQTSALSSPCLRSRTLRSMKTRIVAKAKIAVSVVKNTLKYLMTLSFFRTSLFLSFFLSLFLSLSLSLSSARKFVSMEFSSARISAYRSFIYHV
jgi:hypothetical protein